MVPLPSLFQSLREFRAAIQTTLSAKRQIYVGPKSWPWIKFRYSSLSKCYIIFQVNLVFEYLNLHLVFISISWLPFCRWCSFHIFFCSIVTALFIIPYIVSESSHESQLIKTVSRMWQNRSKISSVIKYIFHLIATYWVLLATNTKMEKKLLVITEHFNFAAVILMYWCILLVTTGSCRIIIPYVSTNCIGYC